MFGTRPENVPEPKALFARARETYENGKENRKIPVNLRLTVRRGEPVRLSGACAVRNGVTIALATGDAPEEARNRAVTAEELRQRLTKTGGTVFAADQIEIELDEGLMVSASAVNALRRELLDELAARRTDIPKRRELPASPCRRPGGRGGAGLYRVHQQARSADGRAAGGTARHRVYPGGAAG